LANEVAGLMQVEHRIQVPTVDLRCGYWQPKGKDPGNGMNRWNNMAYGQYDAKQEYCGAVQNGLPNGWGKWSTGPPDLEYNGDWKDGQANGRGTFSSKRRTVYEGEFLSGEPNGEGRYIGLNNTIYSGRVTAGRFYGQVTVQHGNIVRTVLIGG